MRLDFESSKKQIVGGIALLLGLVLSGGLIAFLSSTRPLITPFVEQIGVLIAWQIVLNGIWLCAGFSLTRVAFRGLPFAERVYLAVATGVAAFYACSYVLGLLHLFHPIAFLAMAVASLCWALRSIPFHTLVRRRQVLISSGLSGLALVASGLGFVGVVLVYLGAFSPGAINFDASWYHLPVAEAYAREGRIVVFNGSWQMELPHLSGVIHTWGFLLPGFGHPALKWMFALHTEFSLFLWTLVGIAAMATLLIGGRPARGTWSIFLLFPGIFVYDGNLGGAADHVLAFFVPAMLLLAYRLAPRTGPVFGLWGAIAGAALMTKLQAAYVVGPIAVLLLVQFLSEHWKKNGFWADLSRSAGWLILGFLSVAGFHFAKNALFHGNPLFPLAQDWFPASRPTVKDGAVYVDNILADVSWRAPRELGRRISEAIGLVFSYSFKPHYSFIGDRPNVGFAFTLSLPFLLLLEKRRPIFQAILVCLGALFFWGFTYRVDRHIQTFLPLLMATTAALMVRTWRWGGMARWGIAALVGVQLVWAFPLCLEGLPRVMDSASLISTGVSGSGLDATFGRFFKDHVDLDRQLPKDAVLLLHHVHPSLGMNRRIFLDLVGAQGSVDYRQFANPSDFIVRLRELGITHVAHLPGNQIAASLQEEAIFDSFLADPLLKKTRVGAFEVLDLSNVQPAQKTGPLQVLALSAPGYPDGIYVVTHLDRCSALPSDGQPSRDPSSPFTGVPSDLVDVDVVLMGGAARPSPSVTEWLDSQFERAATYRDLTAYSRRRVPPIQKGGE